MTPFEVTIPQTVPAMVRFVRAITRTKAKLSSSIPGKQPGADLFFIVWLNPMYIPLFESWCQPKVFQFVGSEAFKANGDVDGARIHKGSQ